MKNKIPQNAKNFYHRINSGMANFWFGFPSRKIKIIGVTGTNGKTTTVQMIAKILEKAGHKVAVASTINFKLGEKELTNKTKLTTLDPWKVQEFINDAVNVGCEYLVLEVSSHSLDQSRVQDVEFDVAVITNVTREHLDYHKTMEEYRDAKMKLFGMLKDGKGVAVVNLDMEKPEEFIEAAGDVEKVGYFVEDTGDKDKRSEQISNFQFPISKAESVEMGMAGSTFVVDGVDFKLNLPGRFNIENALAAICVGVSQGIELELAADALRRIKKIPGRMDRVENNKGVEIIIDYALTPDSMEKLGRMISSYKLQTNNHKLIWVFGSCGERDRGKRPIMGEIVAKYADLAIVTNEDPYNENPQQIIDEVFAGLLKGGKMIEGKNAFRIFDRKQAIKKALGSVQKGDVVLVTGKGAEETMAVGDLRVPWNDRKTIEDLLSEMEAESEK